jgi:Hydrazine synthase alpha subunit middle domain
MHYLYRVFLFISCVALLGCIQAKTDPADPTVPKVRPLVGTDSSVESISIQPNSRPALAEVATTPSAPLQGAAPVITPAANQIPGLNNPILFATQVPHPVDYGSRMATFANHLAHPDAVPRGGDLIIRFPDGGLRNLTKEAGYGNEGFQGSRSIAVRDPAVHWSGKKALFSMVIGAPTAQYQVGEYYWQIFEVTGLGKNERVAIRPIQQQPRNYNNVSPFYGTDERILFTSDRPRNGDRNLYPQMDEYESAPTITGIWSLDERSGDLKILNHVVSGLFSPTIDSFGRIIFTRWDHLQRDQQADADRAAGGNLYGAFDYSDESPSAKRLALRQEVFPESRISQASTPYGPVAAHTSNLFTPWQMNEDGTEELTLNHIGRHELTFGYLTKTFQNTQSVSDTYSNPFSANRKYIRADTGLFHLREDPLRPGTFYGTYSREFGSLTSNQIITIRGNPELNADAMAVLDVTEPDGGNGIATGRFRNPLPTSTGHLLASHTPTAKADPIAIKEFRIREVKKTSGSFAVAQGALTPGLAKSVSWFSPDKSLTFSGNLWELDAVEVVARAKPPSMKPLKLEAAEESIFKAEQVNESEFRNWLASKQLALIVTRNQTSRDRADVQQPLNLEVPGGVKKTSSLGGTKYPIAHYQIFQADLVRGYKRWTGRRPIAVPMHDDKSMNPQNPQGPEGSVKISPDGSTAALVPARRSLTWQTTDPQGVAIVRERNWVSFQPGEIRVCASCHGVNTKDQSGATPPTNPPEALRQLLRHWKANLKNV